MQKTIITGVIALIIAIILFFSGYITRCATSNRSTGTTGTEYSAEISRITQLTGNTNLARATELTARSNSLLNRENQLSKREGQLSERQRDIDRRSASLTEREKYLSDAERLAESDGDNLERLKQVFVNIRILAQSKE